MAPKSPGLPVSSKLKGQMDANGAKHTEGFDGMDGTAVACPRACGIRLLHSTDTSVESFKIQYQCSRNSKHFEVKTGSKSQVAWMGTNATRSESTKVLRWSSMPESSYFIISSYFIFMIVAFRFESAQVSYESNTIARLYIFAVRLDA